MAAFIEHGFGTLVGIKRDPSRFNESVDRLNLVYRLHRRARALT